MILIKDIVKHLENFAPLALQESYDNSGLIVGNDSDEVSGILISLDCTEEVVEEAINKNCNLIISHHPIVFKGLKKFTGKTYVERTILKAIKKDIAIYAIHTNLDNVTQGVSFKIAEKLKLTNTRILQQKEQILQKLVTFVPQSHRDVVLDVLFKSGAGQIGNYSKCSYLLEGTGTFEANEKADPYLGEAGKLETVPETRIEVIFPAYLSSNVVKGLLEAHPYETPAYDIVPLMNKLMDAGSGAIGELETEMDEKDFFVFLKKAMHLKTFRHTLPTGKKIKKVAVCGGSGSFLLKNAINEGAQIFISSDFKYHEFFDAGSKIIIADIGHFESEVFTKDLIFDILNKKFSNIATILSNTNTNPVQYFY